jgi:hypothetical protein
VGIVGIAGIAAVGIVWVVEPEGIVDIEAEQVEQEDIVDIGAARCTGVAAHTVGIAGVVPVAPVVEQAGTAGIAGIVETARGDIADMVDFAVQVAEQEDTAGMGWIAVVGQIAAQSSFHSLYRIAYPLESWFRSSGRQACYSRRCRVRPSLSSLQIVSYLVSYNTLPLSSPFYHRFMRKYIVREKVDYSGKLSCAFNLKVIQSASCGNAD